MLGEFNIEFPVLPLIESQGPTWFQGVSQFDLERKQMTHIGLFGAGLAAAYVAGTERRVFKEKNISRAINGVSAKRQLLGQKVYNDQGEMVGRIDDLILTKKVVTYAIVGAGGFLGLGTHDVAIPAGKFLRDEDRVVLPDASKEVLRDMPRFEYTQITD